MKCDFTPPPHRRPSYSHGVAATHPAMKGGCLVATQDAQHFFCFFSGALGKSIDDPCCWLAMNSYSSRARVCHVLHQLVACIESSTIQTCYSNKCSSLTSAFKYIYKIYIYIELSDFLPWHILVMPFSVRSISMARERILGTSERGSRGSFSSGSSN